MQKPTRAAGIFLILAFAVWGAGPSYGAEHTYGAEHSSILFFDDFATGKILDTEGGKWRKIRKNVPTIITSPKPRRVGTYAIESFLDGAEWGTHGGERCEILALGSNGSGVPYGEYWYGFSVYLPNSWAPDTIWEMIAQFHTDGILYNANPAMAFELRSPTGSGPRTHWAIASRWDNTLDAKDKSAVVQDYYFIGPYETGKWTDFVINVRWAWDHGQGGFLKVWKDGELLIDVIKPTAIRADGRNIPYFKMGIYKGWGSTPPTSGVQTRTAYFDAFRMAGADGSYDVVAPGHRLSRPEAPSGPIVE